MELPLAFVSFFGWSSFFFGAGEGEWGGGWWGGGGMNNERGEMENARGKQGGGVGGGDKV